MSFMQAFRRRKSDPIVDEARRAIAQWTRDILELAEDDVVSVNEIQCSNSICPGTETYVFIMRVKRRTECFKICRPAQEVQESDLRAAAMAFLARE